MFVLSMCCAHIRAQGIIPKPVSQTDGNGYFLLTGSTKVSTNLKDEEAKSLTDVLDAMPRHAGKDKRKRTLLLISTQERGNANEDVALQSYRLTVKEDSIIAKAPSATGLFYALQTLRQLNRDGKIPCTEISDIPSYRYRGLLLDCSRHFWTKEFILKQLDAMAYFKLNRFHFHLVDGGGWRLELKKHPRLTQETAFRSHSDWDEWIDHGRRFCRQGDKDAYGGYYSQDDIREIVAYAKKKHITVIPEIEMPGHSNEVLQVYPELSCTGKGDGFDLCVGNPQTFTFLTEVLEEVMDLFPSEYIHIGGDEATMRYWKTCPKCIKLLNDHHYKDTIQLQSYLIGKIDSFLTAHGRKMIGWDEILDSTHLSPGATVMSWRGEAGGIAAAKSGHHAVMTPSKFCYLDHYQSAPATQPKAIGGYTPLAKTYAYNPMPTELAGTDAAAYIDGVQGNLWTEYIATEDHAEYMMYPRLLAVAEVGWGNRSSYPDFKKRVGYALNALKERGYNSFDINRETKADADYVRKDFEFSVLQWNIWQEGTLIKGGFDAIVDEIARLHPDFVTLSEVRNYHQSNFTGRLVKALAAKGFAYYSFYSYDSGVLSRYPITDSVAVFPENKDHGSIYKLTTDINGCSISVYTGHLDYLDCAYYNVRGYDGYTWKETERPKTVEDLLKLNDLSWRDNAMRCFLNEARHDIEAGRMVIFGGDFNEPSHKDWTQETAQLYDHHGMVVPWTISKMLEKNGYKDGYRELYPNVLTHPGFTYPCYNSEADINKLTWAPKADERERIDFIYYRGNGLQATDAKLFGPDSSVARLKPVKDAFEDPIISPIGTWPTDHKGVWMKFKVTR